MTIENKTEKSANEVTLAIIGRGFAGVKAIIEFINKLELEPEQKLNIVSFDKRPFEELGGAAYSGNLAKESGLNVPAEKMSKDSKGDQEEYLKFIKDNETQLKQKYPHIKRDFEKGVFTERTIYQEYLKHELNKALEANDKNIEVKFVSGSVINGKIQKLVPGANYRPVKWEYENAGTGEINSIKTDITWSAAGNTPPVPELVNGKQDKGQDRRIIQTPLDEFPITREKLQKVKNNIRTLELKIKGGGNTGVDIALTTARLAEEVGASVDITLIQRHNEGIVKHPEKSNAAAIDAFAKKFLEAPRTASGIGKVFRDLLKQASFREGDVINVKGRSGRQNEVTEEKEYTPQDVADGLRKVFNEIYSELPGREKTAWFEKEIIDSQGKTTTRDAEYRFLRNRVTRETGAELEKFIEKGDIKFVTGHIDSIVSNGIDKPLQIAITERKNGVPEIRIYTGQELHYANAAGPSKRLEQDPLLKKLKVDKIIRGANIGGFAFKNDGIFVESDQKALIVSSDHDASILIENSGVREKRERVEQIAGAVIEKIREIFHAKGRYASGNFTDLVNKNGLNGKEGYRPYP